MPFYFDDDSGDPQTVVVGPPPPPPPASLTSVAVTAPLTGNGTSGTPLAISPATPSAAGSMPAADKAKLNGIAAGATANQTDAYLLDRGHHTGSQAIGTVTGLQSALDAKADQSSTYTKTETDGRIQAVVGAAPGALDTLAEIAAQLQADESAASALTALLSGHTSDTNNPHGVTKAQLGLGNARRVLAANETWQIDGADGNDNTADPLIVPFKTLRAAWNYICDHIDLASRCITLQLSAGEHVGFSTYGDMSTFLPPSVGSPNYPAHQPFGGGSILIKGSATAAGRDAYVILQDSIGVSDWASIDASHPLNGTTLGIENVKINGAIWNYGQGNVVQLWSCHLAGLDGYYYGGGNGAQMGVIGATKLAGSITHQGFQYAGYGLGGIITLGHYGETLTITATGDKPMFEVSQGVVIAYQGGGPVSGTWPGQKFVARTGVLINGFDILPATKAGTMDATCIYDGVVTARRKLLANETWQINPSTGNDATTDPLVTPFASLRAAWKYLCRKIDMGGRTLTLQLSAGAPGHYGFSTYGDTSIAEDWNYLNAYTPTGGGLIKINGGTGISDRDSYIIRADPDVGYANYAGIDIEHPLGSTQVEVWCLKIEGMIYNYGGGIIRGIDLHYAPDAAVPYGYVFCADGSGFYAGGSSKFGGHVGAGRAGFDSSTYMKGGSGVRIFTWGGQIDIDPANINASAVLVKCRSQGNGMFTYGGGAVLNGLWPGPKFDLQNYSKGWGLQNLPGNVAGTVDARSYNA